MLLFFFNFLTAQDNQECIVNIDDPNHFIVTPEQIANAASSLPVVFNIAFWQINDEHGYYEDTPLTQEHMLTVIANMNMVYNEFGIFFKYRGLREFNSPQLIDNLDVGLYKIEKQYKDNAKQETVIIKGN